MDFQIVSLILSLFSTLASPGITFFQYLSLFWPNSGKITCILASASPVRGTEDGCSPVLLSSHSSNLLGLQMPLTSVYCFPCGFRQVSREEDIKLLSKWRFPIISFKKWISKALKQRFGLSKLNLKTMFSEHIWYLSWKCSRQAMFQEYLWFRFLRIFFP